MIQEAIDRILQLAPPNLETENGLVYSDKKLDLVMSPKPEVRRLTTLSGLITLLESTRFDPSAVMIQVDSLDQVSLTLRDRDKWGRIQTLAVVKLDEQLKQFRFDTFMEHEDFVIKLLSQFVVRDDLQRLVELASKLTQEASVETTDDGFGQKTVARAGVALKAERTINSRVTLTPFRTFREVEQPTSEFLFRVKTGGTCALFEADGGAWRVAATRSLAAWLTNALRGSSVEALNSLPVVV